MNAELKRIAEALTIARMNAAGFKYMFALNGAEPHFVGDIAAASRLLATDASIIDHAARLRGLVDLHTDAQVCVAEAADHIEVLEARLAKLKALAGAATAVERKRCLDACHRVGIGAFNMEFGNGCRACQKAIEEST